MDPMTVPAEDYALGMMRRAWDTGAKLNVDHIADESGLTRRDVEKIRDWALSGKKGAPPWHRDQGRIPPAPPRPAPPAPAPAPRADHQPPTATGTVGPVIAETMPSLRTGGLIAAPQPSDQITTPSERWREAKDHPNRAIARLHDAVLAAIGAVEDALDVEHDLDLLRVEESSLTAQLARVREKIRDRQQQTTIARDLGPATAKYACDCGRKFVSAQGLATHKTRAHKKAS